MTALRAGVIGLGWAGQQHMAAYADLPGVELVGLAGLEAGVMAELGAAYGVDPGHRYADWQELVGSGELDVVSVATPTTGFVIDMMRTSRSWPSAFSPRYPSNLVLRDALCGRCEQRE